MAHDFHGLWWTTSDGSVFLPTFTNDPSTTSSTIGLSSSSYTQTTGVTTSASTMIPSPVTTSDSSTRDTSPVPSISSSLTPSTSSQPFPSVTGTSIPLLVSVTSVASTTVPITITLPSTTLTTNTISGVNIAVPTTSYSYVMDPPVVAANARTICAGDGLDSTSIGVLATLIFSFVIGLIVWLLFAILRPKVRQLYGLREWFVRPELRPPPLRSTFWAFLFPPVPLVPPVPTNVSSLGESPSSDALLFPSDDELSQRTMWTAFLLVLGWTVIGLAAAIPLYVVNMPCSGDTTPTSRYGGKFSALHDLSVLRLIRLMQDGQVNTSNGFPTSSASRSNFSLLRRLIVNGNDEYSRARLRLMILAIILLVVAVLPAFIKLLREFNNLVAYRRRWLDIRCEGIEMGWLGVDAAPGLLGKGGEQSIKDLVMSYGLAESLRSRDNEREATARRRRRRYLGEGEETPEMEAEGTDESSSALRMGSMSEDGEVAIDVTGVYSVVNTKKLTRLIRARDVVLNNLEQAECMYINSFRVSTPEPSFTSELGDNHQSANHEITAPGGKAIGRPMALIGKGHNRSQGPAVAPTSYLAPSSYYRLRAVRGVSGGTMTRGPYASEHSLTDEFGQRVVGSRFQEVGDRNSVPFTQIPIGSRVRVDQTGELNLDQGPNYGEPDPDEEAWAEREGAFGAARDEEWMVVPPKDNLPGVLERSSFLSRLGLGLPPRGSRFVLTDAPAQEVDEHDWERARFSEDFYNSPTTAVDSPGAGPSTYGGYGYAHPGVPRPDAPSRQDTFPIRHDDRSSIPDDTPPPHLRLQLQQPFVRPRSGFHHEHLGVIYTTIRTARAQLKALNVDISEEQQTLYAQIAHGDRHALKGWLLTGRGLRFIKGIKLIEGRTKDDVNWEELQHDGGAIGHLGFWAIVGVLSLILGGALIPILGLVMSTAPNFAHYFPFLQPLADHDNIGTGLATTLAPALAATLLTSVAVGIIHYASGNAGAISATQARLTAFKATFFILTVIAGVWLIGLSAVLFGLDALNTGTNETRTVSEGAVYIAAFLLVLALNLAFIAPGLLLLQPVRLWRVIHAQWKAITPRQTFRAIYPRSYNPSFATGACILAVFFAATMSLLFPLIGPPLVVLTFLTLIAHRFLIGYVYGRPNSQSGGLVQLWMLKRFATMLCLQPLLLGLLLLANRVWNLGGALVGIALFIIVLVEVYAWVRLREPGRGSLAPGTRDALDDFNEMIQTKHAEDSDDEKSFIGGGEGATSPQRNSARRTRGSFASILDMISLTLAVAPSTTSRNAGPVPLPTETIDDLVSTARAAATNPDAPPRLRAPDPADETAHLLYPPELLAPVPLIWLPNDLAGIAKSEASDLQRYHHLEVVLNAPPPIDGSSEGRDARQRRASGDRRMRHEF